VAKAKTSPGATIKRAWDRLSPLPGGRWLFSKMVGWMAPYSGSIGAKVLELEPGRALVALSDRRAVRNHLNSVHAIALVNLGEVTSGLAMLSALPPGVRSIVTGLSIEYLKKARGRLEAESIVQAPENITESTETEVVAEIRDRSGEVVARCTVRWLLSPQKGQPSAPKIAEESAA